MASISDDLPIEYFSARDGTRLAWRELGEGRPLLLLHGFVSDAQVNWIRYGHAARLAESGFRVIMPDLRGHGASDRPHEPAAYPPDILADDAFALIAHLGIGEHDLGGYSLGGRTVIRMLAAGAMPRRAVVAGMGLSGILDTGRRARHFAHVFTHLGEHPRGSEAWMAEAFLKTTGADPKALLGLLGSFVDTDAAALAAIERPVLVLCGADDDDNGSAAELADALPDGEYREMPGNHMNAVTKPELGLHIRDYLMR